MIRFIKPPKGEIAVKIYTYNMAAYYVQSKY